MDNNNNKNTVKDIQNKNTSTITANKSSVKKEGTETSSTITKSKIAPQTEKPIKKETTKQAERQKTESTITSNKVKEQTTSNTIKKEQTANKQPISTVAKKETSTTAIKSAGKERTAASTTAQKSKTATTSTLSKTTTNISDKNKSATSTVLSGKDKSKTTNITAIGGKEKALASASTSVGGKEKPLINNIRAAEKTSTDAVVSEKAFSKEAVSTNSVFTVNEKTSTDNISSQNDEKKSSMSTENTINETNKEQEPVEDINLQKAEQKEQTPKNEKKSKKEKDIEKAFKKEQNANKPVKRERRPATIAPARPIKVDGSQTSSIDQIKDIVFSGLKILLPVAACIVVVVAIISFVGLRKQDEASQVGAFNMEPLEENAHAEINEMMKKFYTALADGDMDTVRALRDYNDDMDILTYEKKSEFIEAYENVNCYTKAGIEENSYFTYVTYELKVKGDIETKAPGLNAFYIYTKTDGSLVIDGRMEENIKKALMAVTSQDDVVDLYNKINVSYNEAVASDEALDTFLTELPQKITTSVGEALAQLEMQNSEGSDAPEVMTVAEVETGTDEPIPDTEQLQNQSVNQIVKTTDTVNVRSSDSEEADKIAKAQPGTELTRTEIRINGWSKVIYEGKDAYIKSDYLELVSSEAATATNETASNNAPTETTTNEPTTSIGTISAITNVNIRSKADQTSDKLGTAQAGDSFELLEEQGEWYKIKYKESVAWVKSEFFNKL